MQVFKTSLRICFKHPMYLLIYVVALSMMAIFIGKSMSSSAQTSFTEQRPAFAVIDRDGSALSKGLADFLSHQGTVVHVSDTRRALQDAVAQNQATYIAVIPPGFGADFLKSAVAGTAAPRIQTIVSYDSGSGALMNQLVCAWLNTAHTYGASGVVSGQSELVRLATADMSKSAAVTVLRASKIAPPSAQYLTYMLFAAYTIMMAIIVCNGLIMMAFNRTELRKRNLSAPVSSLSRNLQVAAACLVVTVISWGWVSAVGLAVFGNVLAGVAPVVIVMMSASLLAYCTVPLAIGFFLGQLSSNELVLNAVGNIIALVMAFLGGIWIDVSLMSAGLKTVAHFIPTYYYTDALSKLSELKVVSASTLAPVYMDLGMILLFAVAIFAVALVAGRLRMQSSTAGGNAAAARSVA